MKLFVKQLPTKMIPLSWLLCLMTLLLKRAIETTLEFITNRKKSVVISNREAFKDLIKFLKNLTANHPVIRFTEVTLLYEERLHKRNFHESFIN